MKHSGTLPTAAHLDNAISIVADVESFMGVDELVAHSIVRSNTLPNEAPRWEVVYEELVPIQPPDGSPEHRDAFFRQLLLAYLRPWRVHCAHRSVLTLHAAIECNLKT